MDTANDGLGSNPVVHVPRKTGIARCPEKRQSLAIRGHSEDFGFGVWPTPKRPFALAKIGQTQFLQQRLLLVLLVPLALLEDVRLQLIYQGDELRILVETGQFPISGECPPKLSPAPCYGRVSSG